MAPQGVAAFHSAAVAALPEPQGNYPLVVPLPWSTRRQVMFARVWWTHSRNPAG